MTDHDLRDRLRAGADPLRVDPDDALAAFHRAKPRRDRVRRVATITTALGLAAIAFAVTWLVAPFGDRDGSPAAPSGATTTAVEPTGTIAYMLVTRNGEASSLASVDLATGETSAIEMPDAFAAYPMWSPDGSMLAYAGGADYGSIGVTVANADGSDVRDLGVEMGGPGLAWAPDGTTLLSVANTNLSNGVLTIGIDGEGSAEVMAGGSWQGVSWAPDGSRIAMAGHPASPDNIAGPTDWDIYTTTPDGGDLQQLTHSEGWEHQVHYSPDGFMILFTRSPNFDDADYAQDVWVMNADGSDARKLTDWEGFDGFASWSPDGEWILFASDRDATPQQQAAFRGGDLTEGVSLFIMRADGSDVRRIVTAGPGEVLLSGSWTAGA